MRALPFAFGVWLIAGLNGQQPTARLEGVVLDPHTRPVAAARVQIEVDGEVVATTQSDGEGRFVVGRCPTGQCLVRALTDAPDVGVVPLAAGRSPGSFVQVPVMPARPVTGTVKAPDGTPIAGAWVACGAVGLEFHSDHTTTGADGAFTLAAIPFGTNALRVWAEGFAGAAREVGGVSAQHLDVTLTRDDPCERAFALRHASPGQAAAAVLEVTAMASGTWLLLPPKLRRPARSDDGQWWLRGWPAQDCLEARLLVPGATVAPPVLTTDPNAPPHQSWFFVEDPSDTVFQGRLVAEGAASAAGVEVIVESVRAPWLQQRATTDEHGSFRARSPVGLGGSVRLRLTDPALALGPPRRTANADIACEQQRDHVHEFRLRPAAIVRATLHDAAGRPYCGALVELVHPNRGVAEVPAGGGAVWTEFLSDEIALAHTDRRGRIELRHLLRAGDEVVLRVRGIGGFLDHPFAVKDGAQDLGTLKAAPPPRLEARVLQADGTPASGTRVQVHIASVAYGVEPAWTDREGRFTLLDLLPGPCVVTWLGNQQAGALVVLEGGATGAVELRLP